MIMVIFIFKIIIDILCESRVSAFLLYHPVRFHKKKIVKVKGHCQLAPTQMSN